LKKEIYEVCRQHVKYEYIPDALSQYKKILKGIINTPEQSLPSTGVISQQFIDDIDVQEAIRAINEAEIVAVDIIVDQLENFIKNQRFKVLNDRVVELYSSREDRRDEAIKLQAEESVDIVNFSLKKGNKLFLKLFADFNSQLRERHIAHSSGEDVKDKVPFGIDVLDDLTGGGIDAGDTAMWIMRSGVGKSTALKWTGMYACRLGYNVLHIQLEGGKQEAYDKYSQIWTKARYSDVKAGDFSQVELDKINKYIERMQRAGKELYIYSFEKFGEATMIDVRDLIIDFKNVRGVFPDLVIIDSLDLTATGNKKLDSDPNWKKDKMDKVAQQMKDVCTEFYPMRILTSTQTSDFANWNDPDKVMTRSNTEGNRTLVKPFSYVFTFNVTLDEQKANVGRVFIDKFRNYKVDNPVFKIKTGYDYGNFYDRVRTLEMYKKNEKL